MTAPKLVITNTSNKIKSAIAKVPKLKILESKKIYYSEKYVYLDKKEFSLVWHNILLFTILHAYYIRGAYGILTMEEDFKKCTPISLLFSFMSGIGVTCGAHRLWSHKSYKARLPLRILLMIGHTIAGQNNLFVWCRDHRVHHKFSDTDADPHNTNRGFFFAHMGWLMYKKHPDVLVKGAKIDLSDLEKDPVIKFQKKHYYLLFFILNVVIPIYLSMKLCGASFYGAFLYSFMLRYAVALHSTWFVNSAAHMFGDKPYNEKIRPVENIFVSCFTIGEGYHNFHHTFPFDYSTSEFTEFNIAKRFIDFMARRGLAYDLKKASSRIVNNSKINVARILYSKIGEEEMDLNNNYVFEDELAKKCSLNGAYLNDNLHNKKRVLDDKIKDKLNTINRNTNGLNADKDDLNKNNILASILGENNKLKER